MPPAANEPSSPARKRSFGWLIVPIIVFAALVIVFAFALQSGDPSRLPSTLIGRPAPATTFPPLEGLHATDDKPVPGFSNAELATGRPVIVNFWASWCAQCADEQPLLVELQKRTGISVYGVAYKDDPIAARRFLGRYGNPFAAVGTDGNGRAAIEWGVYGMPETFVLNGKGDIVFKHVGAISPESIETKLIPAIARAQTPAPTPATN